MQPRLKRARKTTLKPDERKALKLGDDDRPVRAAWLVLENRVKITALLNLYHELRGHEACHGVRKGFGYLYEKEFSKLRSEFAAA